MEKKPRRFTTYLFDDTRKALKRFAVEKELSEYEVIEAALRKCVPGKFFKPPYKEE